MKKCALCQNPKPLRRSHILPDFLYKPTYDEKHSNIFFDADEERRAIRHSGLWEELFCDDCEGVFNRWESYFADVWFLRSLRPQKIGRSPFTIAGLDYQRFKLFHLSILWRSGVATYDVFRQIRLGPHQDRMRRLLLANDPGPVDLYPFLGVALRDPTTGGVKDSIISVPGVTRIDGHTVYRAMFGGVAWYYAVSSHTANRPIAPTLELDGRLTLGSEDWLKHKAIAELSSQL